MPKPAKALLPDKRSFCYATKGHFMFENPQQLRLALIAIGVIFFIVALAFFGIRSGSDVSAGAAFFLL